MTVNNKQVALANITYERVIWNCQHRFFLDEVDPNNQLIPLSKITLSGISIFAFNRKQPLLYSTCHSQFLDLCCFFRTFFFWKNPIYSSLNINLKIADSSRNSWNLEIRGIRKLLESGNSGYPKILGIRKFLDSGNSGNPELSKQGKLKQEKIAERVSTRVEI